MEVMHFFRNYSRNDFGGVESHIFFLCNALKGKAGFKILADKRFPGEKEHELGKEAEVFRVTPLREMGSLLKKTGDILLNELKREENRSRILENERFDILHVHGPVSFSNTVITGSLFSPFYSLQAWTKAEKPVVMTFHGLPEVVLKNKYPHYPLLFPFFDLWKGIEGRNAEKASTIICVDKYVMDEMRKRKGIGKNKLVYIPNGVDLEKFRPIERKKALNETPGGVAKKVQKSPVVFLFINRLSKEKGVDGIVELAGRLAGDFLFLVVGGGPLEKQVDALCREDNRFVHVPHAESKKVPFFLNACDYVVSPFRHPGSTRTNIEAIACGKPVVTTAIGDRHPVINGRTGFTYGPDSNGLLETLQGIVDGKKGIEKAESNCAAVVKAFDLKTVAEKTMRVYETALA